MSSAKKFQGYNQSQPQVAAATTTAANVKLLAAAEISQWHKGVARQARESRSHPVSRPVSQPGSHPVSPCRRPFPSTVQDTRCSGLVESGLWSLVCSWLVLYSYFKRADTHTHTHTGGEAQRHLLLLAHRVKRTIVQHCVRPCQTLQSFSVPLCFSSASSSSSAASRLQKRVNLLARAHFKSQLHALLSV